MTDISTVFFFSIFSFLFFPLIVIGVIIYLISHHRKDRKISLEQDKNWYLRFSLCEEDTVSQLFLLISFSFLGATLLAFNKDLGGLVSGKTILLLISIIGLAGSYYFKLLYTFLFSLIGLVSWWGAQGFDWIKEGNIKGTALFVGFLLIALIFYILGRLHQKEFKFKRFALIYLILGIVFITGSLFILSTKIGLEFFERITEGMSFFVSWQISISLFILVSSFIALAIYTTTEKLISTPEIFGIAIIFLLFLVIVFLPNDKLFFDSSISGFSFGDFTAIGAWWAVIFNIITFFEILGLIFSGYLRREEWLINLGSLFLFLLIAVKYFDWFFTFFDKSLFFIGAGILLFVVGRFMEKGRKYMISNFKNKETE